MDVRVEMNESIAADLKSPQRISQANLRIKQNHVKSFGSVFLVDTFSLSLSRSLSLSLSRSLSLSLSHTYTHIYTVHS